MSEPLSDDERMARARLVGICLVTAAAELNEAREVAAATGLLDAAQAITHALDALGDAQARL